MPSAAPKVAGTIESLVVHCPPPECWNIFRGETKSLTYKLENTGIHPLKNVNFTAFTFIKSKEQGDLGTALNYAQVQSVPDKILGNTSIDVIVKVTIPDSYNETIKYEGKTIEYPFRVATKAVAIKSIEEI